MRDDVLNALERVAGDIDRWRLENDLDALAARGALVSDPRSLTWEVGESLPPPAAEEARVSPGPICSVLHGRSAVRIADALTAFLSEEGTHR